MLNTNALGISSRLLAWASRGSGWLATLLILLSALPAAAEGLTETELTASPIEALTQEEAPRTADALSGDQPEAPLADATLTTEPVLMADASEEALVVDAVANEEVPVSTTGEETTPSSDQIADAEASDVEVTPMFLVTDLEAALENDGRVVPQAADLAQITQVTDFSDVLPSDWAFQALSNLVENYGCIQGYPDRTFRGQRSLTRFEFAAGLNACLDVLAANLSMISDEDLIPIRRLQEEFAAELATLRGRVDALEAETAELRAQQFATQTKLRGSVFMHVGGGFANGNIRAEGTSIFAAARDPITNAPVTRTVSRNPSTTTGALTWINMDTSFNGSDRLKLQFVAGAGTSPANLYGSAGLFNTFGTPFTFQSGGVDQFDVTIRELSYMFPVGDSLTIDVGARINWYSYFDNNRYTFFLTGANSFNSSGGTQVNTLDRGAGVVAVWDVTDWLDFRVGYLAENTEFLPGQRDAGNPTRGLFGGTNTLTGQIGLQPFDNLNLRLLYTRSNLMPNAAGQIGGTLSEPMYGFADNGFGGALTNAPADTFLVNFDWTPWSWLGFFGRYSYGSVKLTDAATRTRIGDVDGQSFQIGVAFPNLFREGAMGTISYLIPYDVTGGQQFLVSGGGDGGTQQEVEVSYRYPLNRNIAIMPSAYWIMNPNNFSSNPDIFLFNLQAQMSF